ncbi:MAG: hypothetical protein ACFB00_12545 [Parvularculaceae bacterium]
MTKQLILGVASALAFFSASAANAQNTLDAGPAGPDPYALFSRQGFTLDATHRFLVNFTTVSGEIRTLSSGERYGAYTTRQGGRFIAQPTFCRDGVCYGLMFAAYFPTSGFSVTPDQLNAFNVQRPHGNASYNPNANAYVLQRLTTNISGITNGSLAGEVGLFDGYLRSFFDFIRGSPTDGGGSLVSTDAPAPILASASAAPLAALAGPVEVTADDILEDMRSNLSADKIFNGLTNPRR